MRQKADLIQYPIWQKPTTATAQEGDTDISLKQSNRWSGAPARVRLQGSRVNVTTTISVQEEALGFKIVKLKVLKGKGDFVQHTIKKQDIKSWTPFGLPKGYLFSGISNINNYIS